MKNLKLYDAAHNRVSMNVAGSLAQIEINVKNTYGFNRSSFGSQSMNDLVFTMIEKARDKSFTHSKSSSIAFDYVNSFSENEKDCDHKVVTRPSTRFSNNGLHPMDDVFTLLTSTHEAIKSEVKRMSSPKLNVKRDEVNNLEMEGSSTEFIRSKHSTSEVINLVKGIFKFNCASGITKFKLDPVNEYAAQNFRSGRFSVDPSHTQAEWISLLENMLEPEPDSFSFLASQDSVNDYAAHSLGNELPSAVALSRVMDKLMEATYLISYKLTPGSNEYNVKAKELEELKATRKKLQNNLDGVAG